MVKITLSFNYNYLLLNFKTQTRILINIVTQKKTLILKRIKVIELYTFQKKVNSMKKKGECNFVF